MHPAYDGKVGAGGEVVDKEIEKREDQITGNGGENQEGGIG